MRNSSTIAAFVLLSAGCVGGAPATREILFQSQQRGGTENILALRVSDLRAPPVLSGDSVSSPALPAWSPNNRSIAFTREFGESAELYVLDAPGGAPRRLAGELKGYVGFPDWSPDGTRLLFAAGDRQDSMAVYLIQADGSGLQAVLYDSIGYRCPTWAPDGKRFTVSGYGSGRAAVFVVDLNSGTRRRVVALDTAYVWIALSGRQMVLRSC